MPIAEINGAELYYESHGDGEPLLLIPGFEFGVWSFYRQIPVFAEHMRVVSFDPRGVGRSAPLTKGVSVADMANDAAALLDHLEIEKACVLGFSMGGSVAIELALNHRPKVTRLIAAATHHGGPKAAHPKGTVFSRLSSEGDDTDLGLYFSDEAIRDEPDMCAEFVELRKANPIAPGNPMLRIQMQMRFDARDRVSNLDMPVLISAAMDDEVVPAANVDLLAKLLPRARVDRYQGRHLFHIEHALHFNQTVIEFMGRDKPKPKPEPEQA